MFYLCKLDYKNDDNIDKKIGLEIKKNRTKDFQAYFIYADLIFF